MRVLYLSYDGISDFVCQSQVLPYLEGLSRKGHVITLLSFEKVVIAEDRFKADKYRDRLKTRNISMTWLKYHKNPVIPATLFDIFRGIITGAAIIRRQEIEILHARGYIATVIALCLRTFCKVKVIFDMRGFWPDEKVDAGAWKYKGLLHTTMKVMEKQLLKRSDTIVVLTESAKAFIKKYYSESDVHVIPCCADLDVFKPSSGTTTGKYAILYAGSLGSFYNLDKMMDFFVFIKKQEKGAILRIVTNHSKDMICERARSRGLDESDYYVEKLRHDEMPKAFSQSDLSLIFYNRRLSGKGCCPIKFSESLASGVPVVIGAGIGDCDDIVRDRDVGIVLEGYSEAEYASARMGIRRLFNERDKLRSRCRAAAEELFSLSVGIEKYHDIYTGLRN